MIMNVTIADGDEGDDGLEALLRRCGRSWLTIWSVMPTALQMRTRDADADPHGAERVLPPSATRKAAMIPTMSDASTPSRSPMMNVGSMS